VAGTPNHEIQAFTKACATVSAVKPGLLAI